MRIKKLRLLRYGHFTDHELEFAESGLTIIHGPNETGKSTTLSAITDLLYGFLRDCSYDFLWEKKQLRVGAVVKNSAGDELSFVRRKGNSKTVLDEDEAPLPDSILAPFVGGTTRDFFQNSFGLSHERLREGGEAIERADGDLSQILFEAGSGITSLAEIQALLDEEADTIFAPRRSTGRELYQAHDEYAAAKTALKEAMLKQTDWSAAQSELAAAAMNLRQIREEVQAVRNRGEELGRWRQILPMMAELDRLRLQLSQLGEDTALPDNAREKFATAVEQRRHERHLIDQMEQKLGEIRAEAATCQLDLPLLEMTDEIQVLHEKAAVAERHLADLPRLETEIAALEKQITERSRRFSLPSKNGAPILPGQHEIQQLSELISNKKQIDRDLEKAADAEALAAAELQQLKQENSELEHVEDPRGDFSMLQMRMAGIAKTADAKKLARDLDRLEKQIQRSLASLSWWKKDAAGLCAAPFPNLVRIDAFRKDLHQAATRLEKLQEKLQTALHELSAAENRLTNFRERESIATAEDLEHARSRREDAWMMVRGVLDGGSKPTARQLARFQSGSSLVPVYESLVQSADQIADRRFDSVEKIVEHNRLQADLHEKQHTADALQEQVHQAQASWEDLQREWEKLWKRAGVKPTTPEEMKADMAVVASVRDAMDAQQEKAAELQSLTNLTQELTREIADIGSRWGLSLADEKDVETAAGKLQVALEAHGNTFARAETLRARISDHDAAVLKAQHRTKSLKKRQSEWEALWRSACGELKLTNLSPGQAGELVQTYHGLQQEMADVARLRDEYSASQARLAGFLESVNSALKTLNRSEEPAESAAEAISIIRDCRTQLTATQQLAVQKQGLEKQASELASSLESHKQAHLKATDEISTLLELARVSDESELPQAMSDAEQLRRLRVAVTEAVERLVEVSQGEDESSVRAQSANLTLDSVKEEADSNALRLDELTAELESAARREEAARRAVHDLESRAGANTHAQAMQNAVSRMETLSRDYLRLQAASIMLRHGIDRIREHHKNPILSKASGFFKTITDGSFTSLAADYDNDSPTVVGIRPDGSRVYTGGMSTGTRDQLYLALRLAFVDNYCAAEEPLPFIGDDLFVQFDEPRTAAGLRVLSQLTNCQVVLFTHHDHVAQIAMETIKGIQMASLSQNSAVAGSIAG